MHQGHPPVNSAVWQLFTGSFPWHFRGQLPFKQLTSKFHEATLPCGQFPKHPRRQLLRNFCWQQSSENFSTNQWDMVVTPASQMAEKGSYSRFVSSFDALALGLQVMAVSCICNSTIVQSSFFHLVSNVGRLQLLFFILNFLC